MHQAEGRQQQPVEGGRRRRGQAGERRQRQRANGQLNQHDELRRQRGQPFDDRRRNGVHQSRTERQYHAEQVVIAAAAALPAGDDQHHPRECQQKPAQPISRQFFAEQQRPQHHQYERLNVVGHGGDSDRGMLIGGKQQRPVEHQRDAPQNGESQLAAVDRALFQLTECGAGRQHGQRAERAAPKHHRRRRLP